MTEETTDTRKPLKTAITSGFHKGLANGFSMNVASKRIEPVESVVRCLQ